MKPEIAQSIYERNYKDSFLFEEYYRRLENGMTLLINNTLETTRSYRELTDMQLALEYCDAMLTL